jgi:hypothetical protein
MQQIDRAAEEYRDDVRERLVEEVHVAHPAACRYVAETRRVRLLR